MLKIRHLIGGVAALAVVSSSFAADVVVDFEVGADLGFLYDDAGFDAFDVFGGGRTLDEFSDINPAFGGGDTDVFGFAELVYSVGKLAVSPSFALDEVYDWCIHGYGGYEYGYEFAGSLGSGGRSDDGPFELSFTASLSELTDFLFGASPLEIFGVISTLPGDGSLADLIAAINSAAGTSFDWPFESLLSSDDILYGTDFSLPSGHVTLAAVEPATASGLLHAGGGGHMRLHVKAKRRPVSDSGSTSLLALAGFGVLLIARRRFVR